MRFIPAMLASLLILAAAGIAEAQGGIYSFTDSQGNVHYSNVPSDGRYTLMLPAESESGTGMAAARRHLVDRQRWEADYGGLVDAAARDAQVSPALVRAVIAVESAYDARAVSAKGAQGLMQLLPSTAALYGVKHPFDPLENVRGGARYLRDLLKRYDNRIEIALAAYNAGEEAVDRYGGRIPPFAETRQYVPAVLKLYRKSLAVMSRYANTLPPAT